MHPRADRCDAGRQEGAAKPATKRSAPVEPPTTFAARVRVTHRTFGTGVVRSVDGDKLEIKFPRVGVKWIVDSYVTRE
jgi:hypothetical protein